jgi:UDP-hydrolysing UDP-N-acetyl-D-glucosamine 2-epimerase
MRPIRRICFVTGTRAEFGLMRKTLAAIAARPRLELQIVATGMHLDRRHGRSLQTLRDQGWTIDATVPWPASHDPTGVAQATGKAMAKLAVVYQRLNSDIILVVGDRVEAFAAAAAAHVAQRFVAHVHGGDRAPGQVDDALRHAISKLAHIHFPATRLSAERLIRLGEAPRHVHCVGSPGIDGIEQEAADWEQCAALFPALRPQRFALVVLHPVDPDPRVEYRRARAVLKALSAAGVEQRAAIYPNNDPGAEGIIQALEESRRSIDFIARDLQRPQFLALLAAAGMLVGNSSSGIIEAASFGTPVIDIGPRQTGRDRSQNVTSVPYCQTQIAAAAKKIWRRGIPRRYPAGANIYGGRDTARRIAAELSGVRLDDALRRKVITY